MDDNSGVHRLRDGGRFPSGFNVPGCAVWERKNALGTDMRRCQKVLDRINRDETRRIHDNRTRSRRAIRSRAETERRRTNDGNSVQRGDNELLEACSQLSRALGPSRLRACSLPPIDGLRHEASIRASRRWEHASSQDHAGRRSGIEISAVVRRDSSVQVAQSNSNSSACSSRDHSFHGNDNTVNECVCCLSSKKNIVLLPCRHLCMCEACAQALMAKTDSEHKPRCPLCRRNIIATIVAYI
mmetsp:Transcript_14537/g.27928  ORF Transcript_14537/g.27928 Transcript_14537/m.27928 type:complete len:242 (-) Transcript_14537:398-1123(-)